MKKIYLLLLSLSMGLMSAFADDVELTFENVPKGGLEHFISEANVVRTSITKLTITGQLYGDDFRRIRELAGNDYEGNPTPGRLKILDISGAEIVEKGYEYLYTDRITSSTGVYTWSYRHQSSVVNVYRV